VKLSLLVSNPFETRPFLTHFSTVSGKRAVTVSSSASSRFGDYCSLFIGMVHTALITRRPHCPFRPSTIDWAVLHFALHILLKVGLVVCTVLRGHYLECERAQTDTTSAFGSLPTGHTTRTPSTPNSFMESFAVLLGALYLFFVQISFF